MPDKFDIVIAGSGFAGSIAALALHQSGYKVCLIEKGRHPRFAVGESSTPIADMILRTLSETYDLPFLRELSRYGSWQKHHPDLLCGIKRGFSYFRHDPAKIFSTDEKHRDALLVAASSNDRDSDTNWFRADIDAFLVKQVQNSGINYFDNSEILYITKLNNRTHQIHMDTGNSTDKLDCEWFIDATGSPYLLNKFFGVGSNQDHFLTDSSALFSHFKGVVRWSDYLRKLEHPEQDYPYDPDHSALHHLLNEGWMWNLRFKNDLLSAGFVFDRKKITDTGNKDKLWLKVLSRYPSLLECFRNSSPADNPGKLIRTGRLQRSLNRVYGNRWIAMNHTAAFVDPLHSTGIAHSLSGLERILDIFTSSGGDLHQIYIELDKHQTAFFNEIHLIDLLVSGCYLSGNNFDLFHIYTMVYFACTINYEQKRLSENPPYSYLDTENSGIMEMVDTSYKELNKILKKGTSEKNIEMFTNRISELIKPYNTAGLLDKGKFNMYRHTAVEMD